MKLSSIRWVSWVVLIASFSLGLGCQSDLSSGVENGASSSGKSSGVFAGKWTGRAQCQSIQETDGSRSTDSGESEFTFDFDSKGSLLMSLGGIQRVLDRQGASFQFKDSDGLLTKATVSVRTVSDEQVEYVIDSVGDLTQADSSSNFSLHVIQKSRIQLTHSKALANRAELSFESTSEDTNSFSSSAGSSFRQTLTQVTCSGELTK